MKKRLTKSEQIDIFEEAEEILSLPYDFRMFADDDNKYYLVIKPPKEKVSVH